MTKEKAIEWILITIIGGLALVTIFILRKIIKGLTYEVNDNEK